MWAIRTEGLRKEFGHVVAVERLDLEVARGQIFGLIGPDGAGKTTTLRLLATVIPPSGGEARVLGRDVRREAEALRALVGYMPQRFSLYGDLSVWENLNFFADVYGVRGRQRRERIERLLAFARLEPFRNRRACHLSGGMQKKLALACALVHRPQVLLLDEPTTGVDPISRREFWNILADLLVEGVTIVVSTPYMDEAERCSRVGLMYGGCLMVCDAPEQIVGMVPGELIEVHLLPRPGGRLPVRAGRECLTSLAGVLEVQTYGDLLHAFVKDARRMVPTVEGALREAGVPFDHVRVGRPRLEEAFIHLLRAQEKGLEERRGVP